MSSELQQVAQQIRAQGESCKRAAAQLHQMAKHCRNQAEQVTASLGERGVNPAAAVLLHAAAHSLDTAARQMEVAHQKCLQWVNQAVKGGPTSPHPAARAGTPGLPLAPGVAPPQGKVPGLLPRRVPVIGDTDGGVGQWVASTRKISDNGMPYQGQVAGIDPHPETGLIHEYKVPRLDGKGNPILNNEGEPQLVECDGHYIDPTTGQEVYLEAKGNYDYLYQPWMQKAREDPVGTQIEDWVDGQARRQRFSIPPDARLEWHMATEALVEPLQDAFDDAKLDIIAKYVPQQSRP